MADHYLEILCNGNSLNPSMQLRVAKEKYWQFSDQLLTLHYRRRESLIIDSISIVSSSRFLVPRKPPLWIPNHLSINCLKCERDF